MALYTIADLHLSLTTDKPMDVFGSRWHDYAARLEQNWRATVSPADTVILPGDLSWGMRLPDAIPDLLWLDRLPGKKLIGRGNHDYWWDTVAKMERAFANAGITTISFLHNNAHLVEGRVVCGTRGWFFDGKVAPRDADFRKIVARETMRLEASLAEGVRLAEANGITTPPLVFLHFPPVFGGESIPSLVEVLVRYGVTDCYYGHIHGVYRIPQTILWEGIRMTLISADYLDFVPFRIPDIYE